MLLLAEELANVGDVLGIHGWARAANVLLADRPGLVHPAGRGQLDREVIERVVLGRLEIDGALPLVDGLRAAPGLREDDAEPGVGARNRRIGRNRLAERRLRRLDVARAQLQRA